MIQINDDYYEDLTPEGTIELLDALKATAHELGPAGTGAITGDDPHVKSGKKLTEETQRTYEKGGVKLPSPGPMSGRKTCENIKGLTALKGEPWGPEVFRTDL